MTSGSIAAVTDRGHRRPRNEDAMAIATADGRSVVVVCDGVASTANSHLASRAAADAVLAVLEPMLYARSGPTASRIQDLMDAAFAEAQVAVTRVPEDEPDGNDVSPSTTMVAAVATAGTRVVVGNIGDSRGLLVELHSRAAAGSSPSTTRGRRTASPKASRRSSPTPTRTRTRSPAGSEAMPTRWCRP